MANNNYFSVVNFTGNSLSGIVIGGVEIPEIPAGGQSMGHKFSEGEKITTTISGVSHELSLPGGINSWSTIVYTNVGKINVFPSGPGTSLSWA